jgi:hypothetical protein
MIRAKGVGGMMWIKYVARMESSVVCHAIPELPFNEFVYLRIA